MKIKIEETLKIIISKSFNIAKKNINSNLKASNCKNWDSLNFLKLISNLEKSFKIRFNYKEMVKLNSYKNIANILKKKLNESKK